MLVSFVNLTQKRITWQEETSTEKFLQQIDSRAYFWSISLIDREGHSSAGSPLLCMCPGYLKKQSEQELMTKCHNLKESEDIMWGYGQEKGEIMQLYNNPKKFLKRTWRSRGRWNFNQNILDKKHLFSVKEN